MEAVIDKDLASALLAIEIAADALLIVTDVDAVYTDWGTAQQRAIRTATPDQLANSQFAAGSMGPKVRAACWFAQRGRGFAAIGSIHDTQALLQGQAGTRVELATAGPRDIYGDALDAHGGPKRRRGRAPRDISPRSEVRATI